MEKEFVPYKQALAFKEFGFNEPCIGCYTQNAYGSTLEQKVQYWIEPIDGNDDYVFVLAPLYQQAFRWFREKYKYSQYIKEATKDKYRFCIEKFDEKFYNSVIYNSYEEAELECLKKIIEIIK